MRIYKSIQGQIHTFGFSKTELELHITYSYCIIHLAAELFKKNPKIIISKTFRPMRLWFLNISEKKKVQKLSIPHRLGLQNTHRTQHQD